MTANSDKDNTDNSFLSFTVDRDVDVYIAYDANAAVIPGWLADDYIDTGLQINTTNTTTPVYNLYRAPFSAGETATIGGNLSGGASGAQSNYFVIVVEY